MLELGVMGKVVLATKMLTVFISTRRRSGRMFCFAVGLALLLTSHDATARPLERSGRNQPQIQALNESPHMSFRIARGEPDACGPGCREWIAAEGLFDPRAHPRLEAFLKSISGRDLPIFFHSPGGIAAQAMAIGHLMRRRGMTAGVGKTVMRGCPSDDRIGGTNTVESTPAKPECRVPNAVYALSSFGQCNSACVYALMGGKVRQVPPGASLGVHSAKAVRIRADGTIRPIAGKDQLGKASAAQLRSYVREMGIDVSILDIVDQVPFEKIRVLSRDEIARFGIDRRAFDESTWMIVDSPSKPVSVMKTVLQTRGPGKDEFRIGIIRIGCQIPGVVRVLYIRGLGSGEGNTATVNLGIEGRRLRFLNLGTPIAIEAFDPGAMFANGAESALIDFFDVAAAHGSMDLTETEPRGTKAVQAMKLSTSGLASAIDALRRGCVAAKP
jgi:hypothetical protein